MSSDLSTKSIIVTGSGRGIGRAMARALAADGAQLTIADIDHAAASAVAAEIEEAGGRAIAVKVDVTDRASVRAMIARAVAQFGRLDVMFNNAGTAQGKPLLSITEEDWHRMMTVNGLSVLICMQEAAARMIEQGQGGKIVNTGSIASKQCHEPLVHYGASKFAVAALTQGGARAFGQHGITVNAIGPGVVKTDLWDSIEGDFRAEGLTRERDEAMDNLIPQITLGRASVPEDLAGVARFLASSGSDYMTGQCLMVDGGFVFL
ncbi:MULTISPECIES: SDR family NAD(P)-dependent oxidoreductase [Sphingobium]|uniref:SDR family NAD(P)-dependent oxidoreductase n=1 Tax=Sphingobium TaxID=165695 RepID=UPI00159C53B5|nr:glucose 1-dehydrogenase [Sphingobium sp. 15-1]